MREGLGNVLMYNIIILFLVLIVVFLVGTISYNKAFRVNSRIINAIEKYEGYNGPAYEEIDRTLTTIGYSRKGNVDCPTKYGAGAMTNFTGKYQYCVYEFKINDKFYIDFDLPIAGEIKVPIYSKTDQIYQFQR